MREIDPNAAARWRISSSVEMVCRDAVEANQPSHEMLAKEMPPVQKESQMRSIWPRISPLSIGNDDYIGESAENSL